LLGELPSAPTAGETPALLLALFRACNPPGLDRLPRISNRIAVVNQTTLLMNDNRPRSSTISIRLVVEIG